MTILKIHLHKKILQDTEHLNHIVKRQASLLIYILKKQILELWRIVEVLGMKNPSALNALCYAKVFIF